MNRSILPCKPSILHRILAVGIFIMILFSLALPGRIVQAAKPVGPSYIIVFKDTFDPPGRRKGWRTLTACGPGSSTSTR